MHTLVLVRHGESTWNKENVFTGWTDVDLSEKGLGQAHEAGKLLAERGFSFDVAYTSYLKRAIRTMWTILDEMDMMWIPEHKSWRLNERHYGALQGLNKSQTASEYGEEQVKLWRRGYAVQPPALEESDTRHAKHQPHYQHVQEYAIPHTESLKDTFDRLMPYWIDTMAPPLKNGSKTLVVAHGNTLRALIKHLDNLTEDEVLELNIPVGEPLVYELGENLKPHRHYYLSSDDKIAAEIQAVKDQTRTA
jgi:2,3-bisphosphoglycerate-dependent phosphoglycerate mutase